MNSVTKSFQVIISSKIEKICLPVHVLLKPNDGIPKITRKQKVIKHASPNKEIMIYTKLSPHFAVANQVLIVLYLI